MTFMPLRCSTASMAASILGSGSSAATRSRPSLAAGLPAIPKPGSSRAIAAASPATSSAIGPTVSRLGASGYTPSRLIRPCVVFSPASPQNAAGMRTDPPVSVP